jgi:hypothetical protein
MKKRITKIKVHQWVSANKGRIVEELNKTLPETAVDFIDVAKLQMKMVPLFNHSMELLLRKSNNYGTGKSKQMFFNRKNICILPPVDLTHNEVIDEVDAKAKEKDGNSNGDNL